MVRVADVTSRIREVCFSATWRAHDIHRPIVSIHRRAVLSMIAVKSRIVIILCLLSISLLAEMLERFQQVGNTLFLE